MYADPINLSEDIATPAVGGNKTYARRYSDSSKGVYSVAGLTPPNERRFSVSHEIRKGGVVAHMARFDNTFLDAELVPATGSLHIVATVPPNTAITEAVMVALANQMADFLCDSSNASFIKLLNSET